MDNISSMALGRERLEIYPRRDEKVERETSTPAYYPTAATNWRYYCQEILESISCR